MTLCAVKKKLLHNITHFSSSSDSASSAYAARRPPASALPSSRTCLSTLRVASGEVPFERRSPFCGASPRSQPSYRHVVFFAVQIPFILSALPSFAWRTMQFNLKNRAVFRLIFVKRIKNRNTHSGHIINITSDKLHLMDNCGCSDQSIDSWTLFANPFRNTAYAPPLKCNFALYG